MKLSVGSRFRDVVDYLMYKGRLDSQTDLTERLDLSKGYVSQLMSGKKEPSETVIDTLISAFPEISKDWILTGRGLMMEDAESASGIPLIPIDAIGGFGTEAFRDIPVEDYYNIGVFKQVDFLIRVTGDSMAPKYCGGDLVACRYIHETKFFQWGHVYVIDTVSQGLMIKRVQKSDQDGLIVCESENPRYEQFEIPASDIAHIALVVGAITLE